MFTLMIAAASLIVGLWAGNKYGKRVQAEAKTVLEEAQAKLDLLWKAEDAKILNEVRALKAKITVVLKKL